MKKGIDYIFENLVPIGGIIVGFIASVEILFFVEGVQGWSAFAVSYLWGVSLLLLIKKPGGD